MTVSETEGCEAACGETTPITIRMISAITRIGVIYFPTTSTTREGLTVRRQTSPKNTMEKTARTTGEDASSPKAGAIPISSVTAPFLGIARPGPMLRMTAMVISVPGAFPARFMTCSIFPPLWLIAMTPSSARPASAKK